MTGEINSCPNVQNEEKIAHPEENDLPTGPATEGSFLSPPTHQVPGSCGPISSVTEKGEEGGGGKWVMDGLWGTSTSSSPLLYVVSLYLPFRAPNLTFSGRRAWESQMPQNRFPVAAAASALSNLIGP